MRRRRSQAAQGGWNRACQILCVPFSLSLSTSTASSRADLFLPLLRGSIVTADWPMPYKYIAYPDSYSPPFTMTVEGELVTFEARAPVKALVLDVAQEKAGDGEVEVQWSDQCLVSPDKSLIESTNAAG